MNRPLRRRVATTSTILAAGLLVFGSTLADEVLDEVSAFDIPDQPLDQALLEFSKQADVQIIMAADTTRDLEAVGIHGQQRNRDALERLLADRGLKYTEHSNRTIAVHQIAAVAVEGSRDSGKFRATPRPVMMAQASVEENQTIEEQGQREAASLESRDRQIEEIVITGTRIKGADVASSVVTITQEHMRLQGWNDLGEVIRAQPQNFSGGQNPGVLSGATSGGLSNQNITGASSLNLRGLGPDATLTLLNGARLPYDGFFQATDISVIPTAAIDRLEILLDGASAIYGSDAVGGVANIILKRDYHGAELSARLGAATDGGYEQQQYTAVAGTNWGSGGFLITGDFSKNTAVRARQRSYLGHIPNQNDTIVEPTTQKGALFSGHQRLSDFAELALDAFYTARQADGASDLGFIRADTSRDVEIWGVAPSLDFDLPREWSLRLRGFLGRNEADRRTSIFTAAGTQASESFSCFCNKAEAAGAEAEGPLFALPAGDVRFSVGGGWRKNAFERIDLLTGATTLTGADSSYYGYGEINLPVVSEGQGIPLVNRFIVNGALRHEKYDSFGGATTPKFGAIWSLAPGFDIKASWGRSFKVPTLFQQHSPRSLFLYPPAIAGGAAIGAPDDATVMAQFGGNPDLGPERAVSVTAGFVATPELLPGLTLEVHWFDIDYEGRVLQAVRPLSQALSSPAFVDFVTLNPTVDQQNAAFAFAGFPVGSFTSNVAGVPYDPAKVIAIVDNQYANTSERRVRGIDLLARYVTEAFGGQLILSSNGSWITDATRRLTRTAPEQPAAGNVFFPTKFKGRLGAAWSREGFTLSSTVNHIAGVTDTVVTPSVKRDSMTTLDLVVDYQLESSPVGDIGFNLAVTNLLNEKPPFMQPAAAHHVSYDFTNYSGLGRVMSTRVTKRF